MHGVRKHKRFNPNGERENRKSERNFARQNKISDRAQAYRDSHDIDEVPLRRHKFKGGR